MDSKTQKTYTLSVTLVAPPCDCDFTVAKRLRSEGAWKIENLTTGTEQVVDQDGVWNHVYGYVFSRSVLDQLEYYLTPIRLSLLKGKGFEYGPYRVTSNAQTHTPVGIECLPHRCILTTTSKDGNIRNTHLRKGASVPLGVVEGGEVKTVYPTIYAAARSLGFPYARLAKAVTPRSLKCGERVTIEGICLERLRESKVRKNWGLWNHALT